MKSRIKSTKFPVARIKKIMQKDEEVGKVAQATPVVISKALELFLGLIIEKSSAVTTQRGSKRLEVYHLKHAVENTDVLDFLKELVQDVPDPSAGGTIDLEGDGADGKKKRGKGKRSAAGAGAGLSTIPADPDAPAPPKRKRRKKKEMLEAVAARAVGSSSDIKMAEDGHGGAGTDGEDHDYDAPAPQRRRMFDEDSSMQDDPDEYDEDDGAKPPPPPEVGTSYQPGSLVDENYEE